MDGTDPIENYHNIRAELELYDESLGKRPEIVVITKCELPDASAASELLEESLGRPVMQISAVTGQSLPQLVSEVLDQLEKLQSEPV